MHARKKANLKQGLGVSETRRIDLFYSVFMGSLLVIPIVQFALGAGRIRFYGVKPPPPNNLIIRRVQGAAKRP